MILFDFFLFTLAKDFLLFTGSEDFLILWGFSDSLRIFWFSEDFFLYTLAKDFLLFTDSLRIFWISGDFFLYTLADYGFSPIHLFSEDLLILWGSFPIHPGRLWIFFYSLVLWGFFDSLGIFSYKPMLIKNFLLLTGSLMIFSITSISHNWGCWAAALWGFFL